MAEPLVRFDAIQASKDERISSLYLDLGGLDGGGTAKLQEVAAAIDRFRKTGKPVIAFGEYYDQPQYYLAAHADEMFVVLSDPAIYEFENAPPASADALRERMIESHQTQIEVDEPEEDQMALLLSGEMDRPMQDDMS